MKLFIKNMVCMRCKLVVQSELNKLGLNHNIVALGEVELKSFFSDEMKQSLKIALLHYGLELMDDNKAMLIEKVKSAIIEIIHHSENLPLKKLSCYLNDKLNYNYNYISNLFSEVTGITIEHFIIAHKIERAKQLILYTELNLTEIAHKLFYRDVAHLSNQFKKVTGMSPSSFKNMKEKKLKMLDNV